MSLEQIIRESVPLPWSLDNSDWPPILNSENDDNPIALFPLPDGSNGMDEIGTQHWKSAILANHCVNNFLQVVAALKTVSEFSGFVGGYSSRPLWWKDDVVWSKWVEASEMVRAALVAAQNISTGEG